MPRRPFGRGPTTRSLGTKTATYPSPGMILQVTPIEWPYIWGFLWSDQ